MATAINPFCTVSYLFEFPLKRVNYLNFKITVMIEGRLREFFQRMATSRSMLFNTLKLFLQLLKLLFNTSSFFRFKLPQKVVLHFFICTREFSFSTPKKSNNFWVLIHLLIIMNFIKQALQWILLFI